MLKFPKIYFQADLCDICARWFPCFGGLKCVKQGRNCNSVRKQSSNYNSKCSTNNNQNSDNSEGSNTALTSATDRRLTSKYSPRRKNLKKTDTMVTKPLMNGHGHAHDTGTHL